MSHKLFRIERQNWEAKVSERHRLNPLTQKLIGRDVVPHPSYHHGTEFLLWCVRNSILNIQTFPHLNLPYNKQHVWVQTNHHPRLRAAIQNRAPKCRQCLHETGSMRQLLKNNRIAVFAPVLTGRTTNKLSIWCDCMECRDPMRRPLQRCQELSLNKPKSNPNR